MAFSDHKHSFSFQHIFYDKGATLNRPHWLLAPKPISSLFLFDIFFKDNLSWHQKETCRCCDLIETRNYCHLPHLLVSDFAKSKHLLRAGLAIIQVNHEFTCMMATFFLKYRPLKQGEILERIAAMITRSGVSLFLASLQYDFICLCAN